MVDSQENQVSYNDIPVHYCTKCLSLRIMSIPLMEDLDYCDTCGSTSTDLCNILEWRAKYKLRYGFDYLNDRI